MKILSLNAGYFLGYDGTLRDYLMHPLRGVKGDNMVQNRRTEKFTHLVEDTDPDAVLLQEVDQGSVRGCRASEPDKIVDQLSGSFEAFTATKYSGWMKKTPFTSKMSNAVLYREGKMKNHYLGMGTKSLVQELAFEDFSVFSVHLSRFGSALRSKQIHEIRKLADERDEYVVAGDFNFHNSGEMENAAEILDAESFSDGETFPVVRPRKALDMAFRSEGLKVEADVLDKRISDHRPIMLEIKTR